MSQPVGLNYKSRIPQFSDEASIEEALKVYHYGVDNWTSQPIPNDSIEGNFRTLNDRVSAAELSITGLGTTYVEQVSASATPNVITPQTTGTVPVTIRGLSLQTGNLQQWQSSASVNLAVVFSDGSSSFNGYLSVGSTSRSSTTAADVRIIDGSHKGITIRAASSQTANLQEWLASNGSTILGRVDSTGKIFSNNIEVVTLSQTQTLTNKTLTSPSISGGSISNATSISLTGSQAVDSFRTRNINVSTSDPSGGFDGDLWIKYS